MVVPTSFRLPTSVKEGLDRCAAARGETTSALAVRLLEEGLRMTEHAGIGFHDSAAHGRVATLVAGPDVVEVVDVLRGLVSTGEERIAETATWLGIHPSQVGTALRYYTTFQEEVDRQLEVRHRVAAEERASYEAQQALLG